MKLYLSLIFIFLFSFAAYGQSSCDATLSSYSAGATADDISVAVDITIPSGCAWTAVSNANWLKVTTNPQQVASNSNNTANGTGSGRIYIYFGPNDSDNRSGTVTIANQTFTVSQNNRCYYHLGSHDGHTFTSAGEFLTYQPVISNNFYPTHCLITYTTDSDWIHLGTTGFRVDTNFGAARTGTIYYYYAQSSLVYTVSQAATDGCAYTPSATSTSFTSAPNGGSFIISAIGGCIWHAVSNNDWITINNGASWSGSGTVGYIVAANPNGVARTGTITVGGNTFTVIQAGTEKTRKRVRIL